MLTELQKGISAQSPEERSAALESLVTILEERGHELSPEGLDAFADALTRLLRGLPANFADKTAPRLTQVMLAQTAAKRQTAPENMEPMPQPDTADMPAGTDLTLDSAVILSSVVGPILAEAAEQSEPPSAVHQEMRILAAQPSIDAMTTHRIVSRGDDEARLTVAQNAGAVFARSTFTTLAELAISDLSLKNALAARHDLPEGIADRLWPFLSESSRITLLTARRGEALDAFEELAREEAGEAEESLVEIYERRLRSDQCTLAEAVAEVAQEGRLITLGLLLARLTNVAPICGAHVVLSPAERPLVVMMKATKASHGALADVIRLRARCAIGSSKDSRFAAIVMDGIAQADAQKLVRLMGERLEQMTTPRAEAHAA